MRLVALGTLIEVPAVGAEVDRGRPETKPVPVTVTVLPPAWGPLFGLTPVTVGGRVVGVGAGQGGRGPTAVVETVTETVPVPAGTTTVSEVELSR